MYDFPKPLAYRCFDPCSIKPPIITPSALSLSYHHRYSEKKDYMKKIASYYRPKRLKTPLTVESGLPSFLQSAYVATRIGTMMYKSR